MSDDWVKMRTDLYRDPKICIIADRLLASDGPLASHIRNVTGCDMSVTRNVMRNVTVGALVTLWGVTRHRGRRDSDDLVILNATLSVVDDIAELPGLGEAMAVVGWASEDEHGVVFPGFFGEFNVEPANDRKEKNAERQRRHREKSNALRNANVAQQSNAREEKSKSKSKSKSREEETNLESATPPRSTRRKSVKAEDVALPDGMDTDEVRVALGKWLDHKRTRRATYFEIEPVVELVTGYARDYQDRAAHVFIVAVSHSIANNYQGCFPPNDEKRTSAGFGSSGTNGRGNRQGTESRPGTL